MADFNEFILEITVLHHIYCRDGQPAEVLPFPVSHDGAFWGFYWWGQRPGGRWAADPIVAAKGLDPVESALAVTGLAWDGLPVAACALAAWGGSPPSMSSCFPRMRLDRWLRP